MKRISILTIVGCLAFATAVQAQYCTTIDFENIATGTPVFGPYAISPLLSISGSTAMSGDPLVSEAMKVVEEGEEPLLSPNFVAYRANFGGTPNSRANWLPENNAKSFANPAGVRGADSQNLTITFNPDIVVKSFSIDISDYGDWFPIGATGATRDATLTAYDSAASFIVASDLNLTYGSANDTWTLWNATGTGLRTLAVSGDAIASAKLEFEDVDPGVSFDNLQICYCQWVEETGWAAGTRYVEKGNWATYTPYVEGEVTLYAGQTMEAGTVAFSAVNTTPDPDEVEITITLNEGWRFADVDENVKIQGYQTAPTEKPKPGQFDNKDKATASPFSITVPAANFYGVHVDLEWLDCNE